MKIGSKDLIKRIDELISLADDVLKTEKWSPDYGASIDDSLFARFNVSALSFIKMVCGVDHPFYLEFQNRSNGNPWGVKSGKEILKALRDEILGGWLSGIKGLVTAEIFSDFLEMANYLLSEEYKDAAAVMIGGVLEEHLRQLCSKNEILIDFESDGKMKPKKADVLNADLAKKDVYNKLDQKNVTAWLDLRNKAAHGQYNEYNKEQVESMYRGVLEFMTRNSL
jgi:hypothetical protein